MRAVRLPLFLLVAVVAFTAQVEAAPRRAGGNARLTAISAERMSRDLEGSQMKEIAKPAAKSAGNILESALFGALIGGVTGGVMEQSWDKDVLLRSAGIGAAAGAGLGVKDALIQPAVRNIIEQQSLLKHSPCLAEFEVLTQPGKCPGVDGDVGVTKMFMSRLHQQINLLTRAFLPKHARIPLLHRKKWETKNVPKLLRYAIDKAKSQVAYTCARHSEVSSKCMRRSIPESHIPAMYGLDTECVRKLFKSHAYGAGYGLTAMYKKFAKALAGTDASHFIGGHPRVGAAFITCTRIALHGASHNTSAAQAALIATTALHGCHTNCGKNDRECVDELFRCLARNYGIQGVGGKSLEEDPTPPEDLSWTESDGSSELEVQQDSGNDDWVGYGDALILGGGSSDESSSDHELSGLKPPEYIYSNQVVEMDSVQLKTEVVYEDEYSYVDTEAPLHALAGDHIISDANAIRKVRAELQDESDTELTDSFKEWLADRSPTETRDLDMWKLVLEAIRRAKLWRFAAASAMAFVFKSVTRDGAAEYSKLSKSTQIASLGYTEKLVHDLSMDEFWIGAFEEFSTMPSPDEYHRRNQPDESQQALDWLVLRIFTDHMAESTPAYFVVTPRTYSGSWNMAPMLAAMGGERNRVDVNADQYKGDPLEVYFEFRPDVATDNHFKTQLDRVLRKEMPLNYNVKIDESVWTWVQKAYGEFSKTRVGWVTDPKGKNYNNWLWLLDVMRDLKGWKYTRLNDKTFTNQWKTFSPSRTGFPDIPRFKNDEKMLYLVKEKAVEESFMLFEDEKLDDAGDPVDGKALEQPLPLAVLQDWYQTTVVALEGNDEYVKRDRNLNNIGIRNVHVAQAKAWLFLHTMASNAQQGKPTFVVFDHVQEELSWQIFLRRLYFQPKKGFERKKPDQHTPYYFFDPKLVSDLEFQNIVLRYMYRFEW